MKNITIITRCTRIQNLEKIHKSLLAPDNWKVSWVVIFDTSKIKEIPTEVLTWLNEIGCQPRFKQGIEGDFGHGLINEVIDEVQSGYIYVLDDDNKLHHNFFETLGAEIGKNPDKRAFIFNQEVGGRDFTKLDVREAKPENMRVQHIDMAQFVLRRDLIGSNRLPPKQYVADGLFIEDIYKKHPIDFHFIDEVLCHYNFFSGPKLTSNPRILVIGSVKPIQLKSKFFAEWEAIDLNCRFLKTDTEIDTEITRFDPDAIITIGESFEQFQNLCTKSLDIRSRWLHFPNLDNPAEVGEAAYYCATNYILSKYNQDPNLISVFTPIYNTGEKLLRAYESMKWQTYDNWEWVLVNDSTDGGKTLAIADQIANQDCRVKVYDFRKKSGGVVGEAKWRAASLCRGKWIVELDHDDQFTTEALEWVVRGFTENQDCKFVYSDCAEIDEHHTSLTYGDGIAFGYGSYRQEVFAGRNYTVINAPPVNPKTIRHITGVPNHLRAWDRDFYFQIGGYNRRLPIADDYELIVRTFLKTRMLHIPKLLYLQYYHANNTQDVTRKDIQRRVRSIANHYNLQIKNRFHELGLHDWAWAGNPDNPTWTPNVVGPGESRANRTLNMMVVDYNSQNLSQTGPSLNI